MNEIVEKNFFQKNWIFIALCILLIIGGVITFILLKSPNESKENNKNNNNNTNNNTVNNPLSTSGLTQAKVYKPCTNCADPEYDQTVVTITNSSVLNTLISKSNNADEYTPVGGMGLGNNPLKFELSYSNNVTTVLILEEDRIAIKVGNGSYKIYDLSSGSNIKTYVTDLYNQNRPTTNPLSTSGLTQAKIYKPCTNCTDPEYDPITVTLTDSSALNTLISKLNSANEYTPVGGMGLGNNPLKFELSYSSNITTVLILEENRIAVKIGNGSYKIYDLSSGSNIKTYVTDLYNQNRPITNPLSTSGLTQAKIYKPCTNCTDPEYDQTVVAITNSSILNTLISKSNNADEYTPVGGMGLGNNPLKFELSYSSNITTVLILEENRIAVKIGNGSYKIYDLSSGSNIKTYVTNLYNNNK